MAKRPVKRSTTVIDPRFNIPEGVDELVYDDSRDTNYDQAEWADYSGYDNDDDTETDYFDYDGELETPVILSVETPQIIRTSADGTQVIDLVLNVEDVIGASNYEVRVTKA